MSSAYIASRMTVVDSELPPQTPSTNGMALISNGTTASWQNITAMIGSNPGQVTPTVVANTILPSQTGNSGKVLITDGANVAWTASTAAIPLDVYDFVNGRPAAGATILKFTANRAFNLPANFVNSIAKAGTGATVSSVISIRKNGTQFGTITFGVGATTGTFSTSSTVVFAVGDQLSIVAPAVQDAALADIAVTIAGVRV